MKRFSEYIVRYWNDDSIDFQEEIVRCKDCMNYEPNDYIHFTCEYLQCRAKPDDYCAWGERKERNES